jgi:Protein of unknown function (DUF1553)/Protein of unknown function (DUF1549)
MPVVRFLRASGCAVLAWILLSATGSVLAAEKPWPYYPPTRPPVPAVKTPAWVRNPVDAFILAKLEAQALSPAPEADRATLLRRVTFDLVGLPPEPAEVQAFVNDPDPDAYEKAVARLLASPRFGERWATFWLDLARFAETDGFKADDPRPTAWRYRDYVIRSLNADKPYDRFVKEQLAGDELDPDNPEALIATGFNRHFPDEFNAVNLEQRRQEILNDVTDTTASVFLGLTLGCARCHDHKFDPLPQEDYYRLQAFFAGYALDDAPLGIHEELARYREQLAEWEEKTAALRKKMDELEEPYRQQFAAKRRGRFPKEYQDLLDVPPEKRDPLQRQLVAMVEKQVTAGRDEVIKSMKPEVKQQWEDLGKQMGEYAKLKPPQPPTALALGDVGPVAPVTYLLKRGEWHLKGKEVEPGFLSAFDNRVAAIPPPAPGARSSGRRSALAEWLTQADHPLTARVMVNRLWQHHFGRGIVGTPSDFGSQGEAPTHPELLDWLARELVENGWSLKHVHRLMVTSAAYRQASRSDAAAAKVDPENRLLWRANRRRLEGEALRDALLAVSGQLNAKAGGPGIFPELPVELGTKGGWTVSPDPAERNRRSVYVFAKRNLRYPLFTAFDAPDGNETCARRYATTTAPQALLLLNDKITLDLARTFGARVLREAGPDRDAVIRRAYLLALGRSPSAEETGPLRAFLDRKDADLPAAVADLCHVLVNLNEFLYLD